MQIPRKKVLKVHAKILIEITSGNRFGVQDCQRNFNIFLHCLNSELREHIHVLLTEFKTNFRILIINSAHFDIAFV